MLGLGLGLGLGSGLDGVFLETSRLRSGLGSGLGSLELSGESGSHIIYPPTLRLRVGLLGTLAATHYTVRLGLGLGLGVGLGLGLGSGLGEGITSYDFTLHFL